MFEILRKVSLNIDLKVTDQYGATPFHAAFLNGQIEVVNAKYRPFKLFSTTLKVF